MEEKIRQVQTELNLLMDIMKLQNEKLLLEVAEYKKLNDEETTELLETYLKPQYYYLDITRSLSKEQFQRMMLD